MQLLALGWARSERKNNTGSIKLVTLTSTPARTFAVILLGGDVLDFLLELVNLSVVRLGICRKLFVQRRTCIQTEVLQRRHRVLGTGRMEYDVRDAAKSAAVA